MEFVNDLEELERELPRKKFAGHLSILENMVNSDSERERMKFGSAEIYDGSIIPTTQSFNCVPGSRGSNQPMGKGKAKGQLFLDITGEPDGLKL